jgi:hypothetical protein
METTILLCYNQPRFCYYFLSPHDCEPRGCIEINEHTNIELLDTDEIIDQAMQMGRPFRFAITFHKTTNELLQATPLQRSFYFFVVAATSYCIGKLGIIRKVRKWVQMLQEETISYQKQMHMTLAKENSAYRSRIQEIGRSAIEFTFD